MLIEETPIEGAYVITIEKKEDERGFFARAFCRNEFEAAGLATDLVQANVSFNYKKGTLRGMHMQLPPRGETKLVRCTRGAIYDVVADVREGSGTFKRWFGLELTSQNHRMLYVPEGCAHGYITLEDETEVMYQVSQFYTASAERGYRWDDPAFNIKWPIPPEIISAKDKSHPFLSKAL
ncbi:MAG TPA: dTDP-4-dehydrorhamnose 3,5-epimerase [Chitinophagaceae bacterium]|nr:dTDP-4-dehydrorhamnose 3,5-epimerase [Chitinophagaceae bacterium]